MKRRHFLKNACLGAAAVSTTPLLSLSNTPGTFSNKGFNLKYAPHDGMFRAHAGDSIFDQLDFMADEGFTAFEDNGMGNRPVKEQESIARRMLYRNLKMGVFVAHKIYWDTPNLASGNKGLREEFLNDIKASVEVAKRVHATWMTVVPGSLDHTKDMGQQMVYVSEALKRAAGILEPHGLIMVLEPLNFYNHPGMFLTGSAQAYQLCKTVASPSCKILFDIYHQQIQEGNLLPNIKAYWDEIAYFQIGDNPGRYEPGTGEINYFNVFKYIHSRDYRGILGMEHGNASPGKKGEQAVINAYRAADNFL